VDDQFARLVDRVTDLLPTTGATAERRLICVADRLDVGDLEGSGARTVAPGPKRWPGRRISRLLPMLEIWSDTDARGAIAEGDHGDHRGDADDDAEHGQEGAQQVAPDGAQARRRAFQSISALSRGSSLSTGHRRSGPCAGVGRHVRLVGDHDDGDAPCSRLSLTSSSMISWLALRVEVAGRLVGEQHSGRVTMARAMATRCCWPPESSAGV
jgi:hypothetical protein